jgi:hypothetical protein
MSLAIPPLYDKIIDSDDKANLNWTIFFQGLSNGDSGADWSPTFVNLGVSGTPEISGRYYQISKYLTYFSVFINPNGGNTTSTAGSTYIDNFPLPFGGDGIVFALSGNLGDGPGHIVASSNRIYVPSWSAVSIGLTLIGICEVL